MPFQKAERVIYNKNPLKLVICQLRFPPILSIDSEIPSDFQKSIIDKFPLYEEKLEFQHEIELGTKPQFSEEFIRTFEKSSAIKNHEFSSEDKKCKINLSRTFLSISTVEYKRWEEFRNMFIASQKSLEKIYKPAFYTRIGIRYIDVFERSELGLQDIQWKDLINPDFLGLLSTSICRQVKSYENITEINLADNESIARILTTLVKNPEKKDEQCFMVDSDYYCPDKNQIEDTNEKLEFLHEKSTNLIHSIILKKMHDAMEPQKI